MSFKKSLLFCQCLLIATLTSVLSAEITKSSIETQIIDKITVSMFPNQKVTVWGETAYHKNIIQKSTQILPSDHSTNATVLIVSKKIPENIDLSSLPKILGNKRKVVISLAGDDKNEDDRYFKLFVDYCEEFDKEFIFNEFDNI